MGIFGGSFMLIGLTTAVVGGLNVATGGVSALVGSEDGANRASNGMSQITVGAAVGITGFVGFQTGPALTAGGSVRQARAIRQINPSAPRPWLGYSAWVPWGMGLAPTAASFILQPAAYVLAGIQKGKNRLHWDARTAAYYEENRPRVMVNLTPINVNGNKGLALVGTF